MAELIKNIILDILIGDWDYIHSDKVADLLTFLTIFFVFIFIVKLFKWIVNAFRRSGRGFTH